MNPVPAHILLITASALDGDSSAMGTLFQYYRPRLQAHALRICGNTPLAQDAVQDTFIAAFTHLTSLRDAAMFYPWLKKILVNNCYLLLRRERSVELKETLYIHDSLLHQTLDEHFDKISNRQLLFDSLRNLSEELRSVVMLRYFSSIKSYEAISLMLGVPVGTIRSRLAAARQKLSAIYFSKNDADDAALKEAAHWSGYYFEQWNNLHNDLKTRNGFFNHLVPDMKFRFTSGKYGVGRKIIENEINNDLIFGSHVKVNEVTTSGNITVIEADNINNPNYPDRCAPSMAMVFFRNKDRVEVAHIFDSPRPV